LQRKSEEGSGPNSTVVYTRGWETRLSIVSVSTEPKRRGRPASKQRPEQNESTEVMVSVLDDSYFEREADKLRPVYLPLKKSLKTMFPSERRDRHLDSILHSRLGISRSEQIMRGGADSKDAEEAEEDGRMSGGTRQEHQDVYGEQVEEAEESKAEEGGSGLAGRAIEVSEQERHTGIGDIISTTAHPIWCAPGEHWEHDEGKVWKERVEGNK